MSADGARFTAKGVNCTAEFGTYNYTTKWIIDDFNDATRQERILSPKFTVDGYGDGEWHLKAVLRRCRALFTGETIECRLSLIYSSEVVKQALIKYQFYRLNPEGAKILCSPKKTAEFNLLQPQNGNIEVDTRNIKNNNLTIFCDFQLIDLTTINERPNFRNTRGQLLSDIRAMFESQRNADVTLKAGQRTFKAHKLILAARSPVFAAMLSGDTRENRENKIDITDVPEDVLAELLTYIYTDEAPNLNARLAFDLLAGADKYELLTLRDKCEEIIYDTISVETAAEIFVLASRHNAHQLKSHVLRFIKLHAKDFMKTEGYREMQNSHMELCIEMFEALAIL